MKKLLLFFIFINLYNIISCSDLNLKKDELKTNKCPKVFFSSENSLYIGNKKNNTNIDDINFKANLNNYAFNQPCQLEENSNKITLDLLILINPINPDTADIMLPLFVFLYDKNNQLIDRYYFKFLTEIKYNKEISKYIETELTKRISLQTNTKDEISFLTVGFVNLK